jgi:hypothetical protein
VAAGASRRSPSSQSWIQAMQSQFDERSGGVDAEVLTRKGPDGKRCHGGAIKGFVNA